MEANTRMNTDDKLKTAAQLIAEGIREPAPDGSSIVAEPYCWGLTLADVAQRVFLLLKDECPGREEWAHEAMRAGWRSEHNF
jgi:hypothetical protein